jgi:hypothetical protein
MLTATMIAVAYANMPNAAFQERTAPLSLPMTRLSLVRRT